MGFLSEIVDNLQEEKEQVIKFFKNAGDKVAKLYKDFTSTFKAAMKTMDRDVKLSKYWSFLGQAHNAGTYTFKVPEFFQKFSLNEWGKIANGVIMTTRERGKKASLVSAMSKMSNSGSGPRPAVKPSAAVSISSQPRRSSTSSLLESLSSLSLSSSDQNRLNIRVKDLSQAMTSEYLAARESVDPLPAEYDFFKAYPSCVRPPQDQSRCASCWAFAVTNMVSHRVCRTVELMRRQNPAYQPLPKDWLLGPQSLVSCCNAATCRAGGCNGGNMYQALMWADTNPIWSEDCATYESWSGDSETGLCGKFKDTCAKDKIGFFSVFKSKRSPISKLAFSIQNIGMVFGGSDTEGVQRIQRELYDNGPVTVAIDTAATFMGYGGDGVFSSAGSPPLTGLHSGHAMTLVGWGTTTFNGQSIPYWLVQNQWGEKYTAMPSGYRHMVRIIRGTDDMNMESNMMLGVTPEIFNPDTKAEAALKDAWPKA